MSVDNVRNITIIHPVERIKEYRWFSAFFRLIGIFVCENIQGEEWRDEPDFTILINSHGESGNESWNDIMIKGKDENEYRAIEQESGLEYKEEYWLKVVLEELKELFESRTFQGLLYIAEQFVEQDLMRASYAIEYFGETDEEKVFQHMNESKQRFWLAYQKLKEHHEEEESKYFLVALCNCQRRINELYTIIWNAMNTNRLSGGYIEYLKAVPYQNLSEIEERLEKILYKDLGFYSAYAIKGFVQIIDEHKMLESVYAFERVIEHIGERAHASHLWYRMGKYFESIRADEEKAKEHYHKAYERNPFNYRAAYKEAVSCEKEGKIEEAVRLFHEILNILGRKKTLPSLQPIECAYLYKANQNIGELYIRQSKYGEAICYLQEAVTYGMNKGNMAFYEWMFKDKAELFKAVAVKKLQLHQCYNSLMDAYAMTNQKEKMEEAVEEYRGICQWLD